MDNRCRDRMYGTDSCYCGCDGRGGGTRRLQLAPAPAATPTGGPTPTPAMIHRLRRTHMGTVDRVCIAVVPTAMVLAIFLADK